jgi:hypothetical protein
MAQREGSGDEECFSDGEPDRAMPGNQLAAEVTAEPAAGPPKKRKRENIEPEIFHSSFRVAQTLAAVDPERNVFLHDLPPDDLLMQHPSLDNPENRARKADGWTGCK